MKTLLNLWRDKVRSCSTPPACCVPAQPRGATPPHLRASTPPRLAAALPPLPSLHPSIPLLEREAAWLRRAGFTLIELMVVIGIAAMLITMAGTSFFGAMRQESVTKSRNQLRDTLLLARQQACILGKTHVVVCWNSDVEVTVGGRKQKAKQGRYALFQSVGNVWHEGRHLLAPFGLQRETLSAALRKNARAINLFDPDAATFMRIEKIVDDPTKDNDDLNDQITNNRKTRLSYDYWVGGQKKSLDMISGDADLEIGEEGARRKNPGFWVATLKGSAPSDRAFPMAVRVTATFSLPKEYAFQGGNRAVFVFGPEGSLQSGSAASVTAAHSVSQSAKNATFTVSVDGQGTVSVK